MEGESAGKDAWSRGECGLERGEETEFRGNFLESMKVVLMRTPGNGEH